MFEDYLTVAEAAGELGIPYQTLVSRIRRGTVVAEKKGWATFIHKNEVERIKRATANSSVEGSTR